MRENRTHGSEGGDGESRSRPLSGLFSASIIAWIPDFAGKTEGCGYLAYSGSSFLWGIHAHVFSKENQRASSLAFHVFSVCPGPKEILVRRPRNIDE